MKPSTIHIIRKSLKFSLTVVCITAFLVFLAAPTMFGVVLITPSLIATVVGYGIMALLIGLLFNGLKTLLKAKREAK